ncbi:lytic transglycosylase domain-containing protein [Brevundimonas sp. PAMC22021]|uniref:lytic transglycosylase domain-containing protein n=1 Tax=Brevundimonas sp. PAMC22021 TaxID=2861285 RepID=UPI002101DF92|nr:lytic transglycosylase domain-containing protein [Brevundimonas sp. PAMC22021]
MALTAAVALVAGSARAQSPVDWSRAGGGLFAVQASGDPIALDDRLSRIDRVRLTAPAQPLEAAVAEAAERHGLDRKLLHALVVVESAYQVRACSPAGACGLTQLMPGTAADLGVVDRFDAMDNLRGGADYLARQIRRFGDLRLALAAYNAGPGRVARLGRIPDIPETRSYVAAVINCYLALTAGRGVRSSRQCASPEAGL